MTPQHMVEHLAWALELSMGKATVPCRVPANLRRQMKAWLYDDRPNPRGFANPALPDEPPPLRHPSLTDAKAAFETELLAFTRLDRAGADALYTHPVLGPLAADEWERVHFKHSYHHLLQFDLVREA